MSDRTGLVMSFAEVLTNFLRTSLQRKLLFVQTNDSSHPPQTRSVYLRVCSRVWSAFKLLRVYYSSLLWKVGTVLFQLDWLQMAEALKIWVSVLRRTKCRAVSHKIPANSKKRAQSTHKSLMSWTFTSDHQHLERRRKSEALVN